MRTPDHLELELQTVVNCHMGAANLKSGPLKVCGMCSFCWFVFSDSISGLTILAVLELTL